MEAATRTAMVEVASSWSAISTRAAFTPRTRAGLGSGLSRAVSRAAMDAGELLVRRGAPVTHRERPAHRFGARAGTRPSRPPPGSPCGSPPRGGGRNGAGRGPRPSPPPSASGRRRPSPAVARGRRASTTGRADGASQSSGATAPPGPDHNHPATSSNDVVAGQFGGQTAPEERAVVGQLGDAGGHGDHAGLHRLALAGAPGQALHVVQGEQAPSPPGAPDGRSAGPCSRRRRAW